MKIISRNPLAVNNQTSGLVSIVKYKSFDHADVTFQIYKFKKRSKLDVYLRRNDHRVFILSYYQRLKTLYNFNDRANKDKSWCDEVKWFISNRMFYEPGMQSDKLTKAIQSASKEDLIRLIETVKSKEKQLQPVAYDSRRFKNAFLAVAYNGDWIEMSVSVHPDRRYRGKGTRNEFQFHMFIQRDLQFLFHQRLKGQATTPGLALQLHCAAALALNAEYVISRPLKKMADILSEFGHFNRNIDLREEIGEVNNKYFERIANPKKLSPPNFRSSPTFVTDFCLQQGFEESGDIPARHVLKPKDFKKDCQCCMVQ